MTETRIYLSTGQHWDEERSQGYNKLGWAKSPGPLDKIVELADLCGEEVIVDAGTGTQIVLDKLSQTLRERGHSGVVIGFDASHKMMSNRDGVLPANARLLLADFYKMPFSTDSADVLTARHVVHNLEDVQTAILEIKRVLRKGGRFIGVEYVAVDEEVLDFERKVFDLKEPGRNLWTGEQFRDIVHTIWNRNLTYLPSVPNIALHFFNLESYSVRNWMQNSGLSENKQQEIVDLYRSAPENIVKKMNIIQDQEDVFTDRLFAHIVATK